MKKAWVITGIVVLVCLIGLGVVFVLHNNQSVSLRDQCYRKIVSLDDLIQVSYSSRTDFSAVQKIADDMRALDGIDSVVATSATDTLQSFKRRQGSQGNQTVLNALSELGGNPLDATIEIDVKSENVSSTLLAINTENSKYGLAADSISSMEPLKQSTLQWVSSTPDSPSSTQFFKACMNSTSTVFSPGDFQ